MHVILKEVWYITLKVMWAKKNEAIIWFKRLNWKSMNNSKWIYNSNLVYVTTWWEHWCGTLTHFSSVPMKMWGEIESLISSCMAVIDSLGKNLSFRKCWHCAETENTQFNSKHLIFPQLYTCAHYLSLLESPCQGYSMFVCVAAWPWGCARDCPWMASFHFETEQIGHLS